MHMTKNPVLFSIKQSMYYAKCTHTEFRMLYASSRKMVKEEGCCDLLID